MCDDYIYTYIVSTLNFLHWTILRRYPSGGCVYKRYVLHVCYPQQPRQSSLKSLTLTGLSTFNRGVKGPNQDIKNSKPSHPDPHKSRTRLGRHRGGVNEKKVSNRKIINETQVFWVLYLGNIPCNDQNSSPNYFSNICEDWILLKKKLLEKSFLQRKLR